MSESHTVAVPDSPLRALAGWDRLSPDQQQAALADYALLNPRQQRFILEYLHDLCASGAARRVGYERSAGLMGHKMRKRYARLLDPLIAAQQAHLAATAGMTREDLSRHLTALIRFDSRQLFDANGDLKPIPDLDEATMVAVTGYDVTEQLNKPGGKPKSRVKRVKFCNRVDAAHALMKLHGWGIEKVNVTTTALDEETTEMLMAMRDEMMRRVRERDAQRARSRTAKLVE